MFGVTKVESSIKNVLHSTRPAELANPTSLPPVPLLFTVLQLKDYGVVVCHIMAYVNSNHSIGLGSQ